MPITRFVFIYVCINNIFILYLKRARVLHIGIAYRAIFRIEGVVGGGQQGEISPPRAADYERVANI